MSRETSLRAITDPFGFHPGTKIPRKSPQKDEITRRGTCNICGEKDLVWEQHGEKWLLVDVGGNKHVCKKMEVDE